MRVSKNRQSGFIKNCSSPTNFQPQYQAHYQSKDNESFSKFDDEFSSFCYKYPQEESQNQFSLFVFNKHQDNKTKDSKNTKPTVRMNAVKENDYKMSNKGRNQTIESDEKVLDKQYDLPQGNMRQTHLKFNNNKPNPIKRITTNYYSATTTYAKTNKIGADNNYQHPNADHLHYDNHQVHEDNLRQNYMTHRTVNSPRYNQLKQVGKLIKTSKDQSTQRYPIQFNKKYHEDMYENGEQYYRERELQAQRTGFNPLKKVKSDENLFKYHNMYTEQFVPRQIVKITKNQVMYPLSPRIVSNQHISYQEPFYQAIKRNYKEVSQSQVIQSQPSFLKERLQEVERRKLQLLQKKRQLEQMKRISRHIMEEQNVQMTNQDYYQGNKELQKKNQNNVSQSRKIDNKIQKEYKVKDISSLNQSSDRQSLSQSSDQNSEKTSSQKDQSESRQQDFQGEESSDPKQSSSNHHQSSSQTENNNIKYQQQIQINQQTHHQQQSPLSNIPKSHKISNFPQANSKTSINYETTSKSSIHTKQKKTTPLKIIKEIQKRSQQLKQQELKQMYQKQGISVAKGGVSFEVNTKDFIYPQKDTTLQNPHSSPSENTLHKQGNLSKESSKNHSRKPKINSKQQLKRRRQLAKSYDRYTRNKIFGAY